MVSKAQGSYLVTVISETQAQRKETSSSLGRRKFWWNCWGKGCKACFVKCHCFKVKFPSRKINFRLPYEKWTKNYSHTWELYWD